MLYVIKAFPVIMETSRYMINDHAMQCSIYKAQLLKQL